MAWFWKRILILHSADRHLHHLSTGTITSHLWAFGDGITSSLQRPPHIYGTAGVCTISLEVSGPGGTDTLTRSNYIAMTAGGPVTTARVISYTYNPLNRLTGADYLTGERFEYAYNAVGNRTAMTETAPLAGTTVTTYTYDAANRLLVSSSPGHLVTYGWDARGNLVSDGVFTYTYNAAGRMVRVEGVTLTLVYTYNANGLRVEQSVDGDVITFTWDWVAGVPELLVTTESTNPDPTLYLVGHETLARWDSDTWTYHLPDALGSVRQVADGAGSLASSREWTPYGVEVGGAQAGLGYTGEWWDADAGLLYLRARWYEPGVGRFTQRDVWEGDRWQPITLQPYLYVSDNPINQVDPSGHYGREEVHYGLTKQCALGIIESRLGNAGGYLAELIARGDRYMDQGWAILYMELHFRDWETASGNAYRAIGLGHPYVFGATLHQVQDYFSHYREGYRFPGGGGHVWHSTVLAPLRDIDAFYEVHSRPWVEARLSALYPGVEFGEDHFTDDELIDLYLREWMVGLSQWSERDTYGYRTDAYYPHTYRDRQMEWETRRFVQRFVDETFKDSCRLIQVFTHQYKQDPAAVQEFFGLAPSEEPLILP